MGNSKHQGPDCDRSGQEMAATLMDPVLPERALTLIQPWAHAIANLGKWIENRIWCPPRALLGQRICIHAGAKLDRGDVAALRSKGHVVPDAPATSAIVGTSVLAGWVRGERNYSETLSRLQAEQALASEWYVAGQVAWVLRDTVTLATPIPCKGALGLWRVPVIVRNALGGLVVAPSVDEPKRWVVHRKHAPYDVLIARPSVWGNPFSHLQRSAAAWRVASREEAIERYEAWLLSQPHLVERARNELRGKVLGCWCSPLPCHGDVLARVANGQATVGRRDGLRRQSQCAGARSLNAHVAELESEVTNRCVQRT